jgi:hypothetical protein
MPTCQAQFSGAVDNAIDMMANSSPALTDNLPDLYSAIRAKAPNARVYVLGYPRLFAENRNSACSTGPAPTYFFSVSDMKWINSEIFKFDKLIEGLSQAQGFTYVPEYDAFNGHELCSLHPYLNSATITNPAGSFHPNVDGQARLPLILARYLR